VFFGCFGLSVVERAIAQFFLKARGGAHPRSFLLRAKKKRTKEKAPPRLGLRFAPTSLRSSAKTGAAELAISDRSDSPRFSRF